MFIIDKTINFVRKKGMKIKQTQLLDDLITMTQTHIKRVEAFFQLDNNQLNFKKNENSWSVLECIEHLNRYGDFYIPEITKRISGTNTTSKTYFKSGLLGNYFAKSMMLKEKLNKMKTFKSMNPINSSLSVSVLDKFLLQLKQILEILNKCKGIDIQNIKTAISISKINKLKLGDTLRVVIYHNERHLQQAEKIN